MNPAESPEPSTSSGEVGRSKICSVCGCQAESYHLNYGVSACFSCRAFFRRSVSKPSSPRLLCKKDNSCSVTFETRRNCPGCRFQKCLNVGMNPQAVMDDTAKKIRFRKVLKKVEVLEGTPGDRLKFPRKNKRTQQSRSRRQRHSSRTSSTSSTWIDNVHLNSENHSNRESRNSESQREENAQPEQSQSELLSSSSHDNNSLVNLEEATSTNPVEPLRIPLNMEYDNAFLPGVSQTQEPVRKSRFLPPRKAKPKNKMSYKEDEDELDDYLEQSHFTPVSHTEELSSSSQVPTSENIVDLTQEKQQRKITLKREHNLTDTHFNNPVMSNSTIHLKDFCYPGDDVNYEYLSQGNTRKMRLFANRIRTSWFQSCKQMEINPDFKENLIAFHLGFTQLSKALLFQHFMMIGALFHDFALQQPEFCTLSNEDQNRLLKRKTPLFIQYILSRYLTASSGREQISWLLVTQAHTSEWTKQDFNRISFELFDQAIDLFATIPNKRDEYHFLADSINHSCLDTNHNYVVALACLYSTRSSFLDDPPRIQSLFEDVLMLVDWAHETSFLDIPNGTTLTSIITKAGKISSLFEKSGRWNVMNELGREITLFNTWEENHWLFNKLEEFASTYDSVSVGEESLNDLVMLSFDVPPSKNFVDCMNATFLERCRRILMLYDDFKELTSTEQKDILMTNFLTFSSVISLRSQCMTNGYLQLKFITGGRDHQLIMEKYYDVSDKGRKLKKLTLSSINESAGGNILPQELGLKFDTIVANLMKFVKLLSLIVLFETSCLSTKSNPNLDHLQDVYKRHLFKRVCHENSSTEVNKVFDDLKKLSEVLKLMQDLSMNSKRQ